MKHQIQAVIAALDPTNAVPEDQRVLMAQSLETFVYNSIRKYVTGQVEHGGDIRDRDLRQEQGQELYDFFWYHEAEGWPKKDNRKPALCKLCNGWIFGPISFETGICSACRNRQ